MIIASEEFQKEFGDFLKNHRMMFPEDFYEDGRLRCSLRGAGFMDGGCGDAVLAFVSDQGPAMIFLCVNHAFHFNFCAAELAADVEAIKKQFTQPPYIRDAYGVYAFTDADGVCHSYRPGTEKENDHDGAYLSYWPEKGE